MQQLIADFPEIILEFSNLGLLAVDTRFNIILWNRFMEIHSRMKAEEVLGHNIFTVFPELNRKWLEKKFKTVIVLKKPSFTSWRQRPRIFNFDSTQAIIGEETLMFQDCSFWAIIDKKSVVRGVCISVQDMTEVALTQKTLKQITEEAIALEEASQRDGLTQLYNRPFFDEQIIQEMHRAKRYDWGIALLMLDIDFFKNVNDTYGHPCGDEVLRQLAVLMSNVVRDTDIICRYGGEEFSIIMPQVTNTTLPHVCKRLLDTVRNSAIIFKDIELKITVSIGCTFYDAGMLPGTFLSQADQALYYSKQNGRNQATLYPDIKL